MSCPQEVTHEDGADDHAVMISISYKVAEERIVDFQDRMRDLREARYRLGAFENLAVEFKRFSKDVWCVGWWVLGHQGVLCDFFCGDFRLVDFGV